MAGMKTQIHLTPALDGTPIELDDFLSASGEEGHRYEIIDGRLAVSPLAGRPHEDLIYWIVECLRDYARMRPTILQRVMAPARVFVPGGEGRVTAPEPDIACYRVYPGGPFVRRDWRDASPLIVVEVLSADTAEKDLVRNRRLYLRVPSIEEYWMLDPRESPDEPSLTILRRRGRRWAPAIHVPAGGTVTSAALPGFSLVLDPPEERIAPPTGPYASARQTSRPRSRTNASPLSR